MGLDHCQLIDQRGVDRGVCLTLIRENVALGEAPAAVTDIFTYAPRSYGAQDYKAFADESMRLADGEVSDVITSQFGYHIIRNAGVNADTILNDYYFLSDLESNFPTMILEAILNKADELGFAIKNEDLKTQILSQLEEN